MSTRIYVTADEAVAILTSLRADKKTIDKVRARQTWDRSYSSACQSTWAGSDIPEETLYEVVCYGA